MPCGVCVNGGMEWVVVGVAWCGQHTARLGVCGGACGVCVWQWCMHQVPCVCEGGGGTRALVVVVGGKASVMVAWEAHTGHTCTTKHHHGPHHQSRCVCVCVMVGHKGRGGGDHTSNHPCMGHACASRVCVCVADESRWMSTRTPSGGGVWRACGQSANQCVCVSGWEEPHKARHVCE